MDLVVIGAGIVGLATAHELLCRHPGLELGVIDKEPKIAAHQTGHNSGVIHSGLYYRPGTARARLAVEGAQAMVEFCREHNVRHEVCGKLVVATRPEELPRLEELARRGAANGVTGLERVPAEEIGRYEPHVRGVAALRVPSTGIVDFREVAEKLAELVRGKGASLWLGEEVHSIREEGGSVVLETNRERLRTRFAVNCGGLFADRLARMAGLRPDLQVVPFRGEYWELRPERRELVRALVYPVPDPALPFLGVHFSRRVDGRVDAGPNAVLALRREGYSPGDFSFRDLAELATFPGFWRLAGHHFRVGAGELWRSWSRKSFARALGWLVPELEADDLVPAPAGVRAQAVDRSGALVDDFVFARSERVFHVLNAPSPAATASLAIGRAVADELKGWLARTGVRSAEAP